MTTSRPQAPWSCPICGHPADSLADALAHGREQHPAVLPAARTIAQRLDLIATLADEAQLTIGIGAPNPSGDRVRARRDPSGRTPADLAALDLAAPADDDHPDRPLSLLVECSRLCWDATPLDVHQAHPQPDPPCTLATEARWLAGFWPAAQPWLDACDYDWIDDNTSAVLTAVAAAARVQSRPVHPCPACGERLDEAAGGWLWCRACGSEWPGPERLAAQWRKRPEMSTSALASELGINPNRIHKWAYRRLITPVRTDAGVSYWRPQDVLDLLFPSADVA